MNGSHGSGAVNATSNYYHSEYKNTQNPGTLWYHDHAMHATRHNVAVGLAGLWLIRNQSIEYVLPFGQF
jgi:spore coat protein A